MKKADIEIGKTYVVKVSGILAPVRITGESRYGGWDGVNTRTGRTVHIKGAQRVRRPWVDHKAESKAAEQIREVLLLDGRNISVKGRGFTTYWLNHGCGPYDEQWFLASPIMRELIDEADKA